jgi:hypothetical protein
MPVIEDKVWENPLLFRAVIRALIRRWDLETLRRIAQEQPANSHALDYFRRLYEEIRREESHPRLPTVEYLRSNGAFPDA